MDKLADRLRYRLYFPSDITDEEILEYMEGSLIKAKIVYDIAKEELIEEIKITLKPLTRLIELGYTEYDKRKKKSTRRYR